MPRGHIETYPSASAIFATMQVANKHCIVVVFLFVCCCCFFLLFFLNMDLGVLTTPPKKPPYKLKQSICTSLGSPK